MYSGEEDSSGDALNSKAHFGKWINQSSSNIPKNDVDWAALAQQWIQMKESCTATNTLVAPPPPKISIDYEEKGEAPMEVVKDDENINIQINSSSEITYPNQQQWQPSWYTGPSQWRAGWNSWSNTNSIPQIRPQELSLNSIQSVEMTKDVPPIVSQIKIPINEPAETTSAAIDATRRKTLPAWIREGLEKMEKEKLKQLEKHKDVIHKESSSKEIQEETLKEILIETTNTVDENSDDPDNIKEEHESIVNSKNKNIIKKSREELLEEWMLVVRKSLTELLLEVTNEEIISVAQETLRKNKIKASSAQVFRKSAISSITGKLGLGAYADSASESSSESDDNQLDEHDSEEEIKENIRIRQNAFKVIAQEIESTVLENEQKESSRRNAEKVIENFETTKKAFDKDFGETQPDKKIDSNGKRNRERTSRFSDAKESKHRTTSTYIIQTSALPPSSSSELEKRKTKKKYSSASSSDSFDSYRNRRHKHSKNRNQKSSSIRREGGGSRLSSDSDDYSRRKKYRKYSKDRSRSRSRSHSYTSRRSEQRH